MTREEKAALRELFGNGMPSREHMQWSIFSGPLNKAAWDHVVGPPPYRPGQCCGDELAQDRVRGLLAVGFRWLRMREASA